MLTGIKVFLVVFSCAPDLLHCHEVRSPVTFVDSMSVCDNLKTAVIQTVTANTKSQRVVLARCRYGVANGNKFRPTS